MQLENEIPTTTTIQSLISQCIADKYEHFFPINSIHFHLNLVNTIKYTYLIDQHKTIFNQKFIFQIFGKIFIRLQVEIY